MQGPCITKYYRADCKKRTAPSAQFVDYVQQTMILVNNIIIITLRLVKS